MPGLTDASCAGHLGLDELMRRFDRSASWVSRRLCWRSCSRWPSSSKCAEGQILTQAALKFLLPVTRQSLEDCQRMAMIFAQKHCDTLAGNPPTHFGRSPVVFPKKAAEKAPAETGTDALRDLR